MYLSSLGLFKLRFHIVAGKRHPDEVLLASGEDTGRIAALANSLKAVADMNHPQVGCDRRPDKSADQALGFYLAGPSSLSSASITTSASSVWIPLGFPFPLPFPPAPSAFLEAPFFPLLPGASR